MMLMMFIHADPDADAIYLSIYFLHLLYSFWNPGSHVAILPLQTLAYDAIRLVAHTAHLSHR